MLPVDVALQPIFSSSFQTTSAASGAATTTPRDLPPSNAERLPQRVGHTDRRRMMVHSGNPKVVDHGYCLIMFMSRYQFWTCSPAPCACPSS